MTEQTADRTEQAPLTDVQAAESVRDRLEKLYQNLIVNEEDGNGGWSDHPLMLKRVKMKIDETQMAALDSRIIRYLTERNPERIIDITLDNSTWPWLRVVNLGAGIELSSRRWPPFLQTDHKLTSSDPIYYQEADSYLKDLSNASLDRQTSEGYKNISGLLDGVEHSSRQQGLLKQPAAT